MGSSAALALVDAGHSVTVFEQFSSDHLRGSSHGRSRIIRRAYPDEFYTSLMTEAYPLWHALEIRSGRRLVHETGLLFFGQASSPNMVSMQQSLNDLSVPHRVVSPSEIKQHMAHLVLSSDEVAIAVPEAGWVAADQSIHQTRRLAGELGVEFRFETRVDRSELESFDRFVVCAGSWIVKWLSLPLSVHLQTFAYDDLAMPNGPVWIEDDGFDFPYGFPSEAGSSTFKMGIHRAGAAIDPDNPNRSPDPEEVERILDFTRRRFGHASARITEAHGCLYTVHPNDDFLFGRIGDKGFYASPCSGHGFKFGPWVGQRLARFVDETDTPERLPRICGLEAG
jgi:glycine/D-amino acid oxidase-like deaminating enzyme